jgi:hypothetical protein
MKKPKKPEEYFWETTIISEKTISSGEIVDDKIPIEYSEIVITEYNGDPIDSVKIVEYKHKKIRNPKYSEELAIYLKEMEAYKEKCAEIYKKSQETQRLNAIKKLEKLEKLEKLRAKR